VFRRKEIIDLDNKLPYQNFAKVQSWNRSCEYCLCQHHQTHEGYKPPRCRPRLAAGMKPASAVAEFGPYTPVSMIQLMPYTSAAALSLIVTALIVAGNQRVFPRAVGMPSAISPSAIA
jgi:hypothetical protein